MKRYSVTYELEEAGWWIATVKGVPGCHTQGRSLEEARTRIQEALELAVPGSPQMELKEAVRLPAQPKKVLAKRLAAKKKLEKKPRRRN